jgi:uncharacterized protein
MKFIAAIVAIAFVQPVLVQPALADQDAGPGLMTITGTGTTTAAPDMAVITSGVVTNETTARAALSANTEAMAQIIEILKAMGIKDRDIQTSGFSVQPNFVFSDRRDDRGYQLPPRIVGYRVSNNLTVRVRELADLGIILDRSVTVGANAINGVTFTVAEDADLLDIARRAAIADAFAKARLYAGAAGVELGNIRSISEQGARIAAPLAMAARVEFAADGAVPVEAGELSFSMSVNMVWELVQ